MPYTDKEKSTLARMAGNIAAGIASRKYTSPGSSEGQESLAASSVAISVRILEKIKALPSV